MLYFYLLLPQGVTINSGTVTSASGYSCTVGQPVPPGGQNVIECAAPAPGYWASGTQVVLSMSVTGLTGTPTFQKWVSFDGSSYTGPFDVPPASTTTTTTPTTTTTTTATTSTTTTITPPPVVPDGLFTDLVRLDRRLAKLIGQVRTNGADSSTVHAIIDIHDAKLRMVDRYFDQPVYGLRFSEVFDQLDCLDSSLALANGVMTGVGTSHLGSKEDERVIRLLEQGKKCKQKLENDLHGAANVPEELLTDLVKLDRRLAKLIGQVRTNGADSSTVHAIIDIHDAKLRMVDRYFDQPVYGLRFSEVFDQLDCLDSSLALANGVMTGVGTSHLGSKEDERVIRLLEQGKKCKQKLENDLHKANRT